LIITLISLSATFLIVVGIYAIDRKLSNILLPVYDSNMWYPQ